MKWNKKITWVWRSKLMNAETVVLQRVVPNTV